MYSREGARIICVHLHSPFPFIMIWNLEPAGGGGGRVGWTGWVAKPSTILPSSVARCQSAMLLAEPFKEKWKCLFTGLCLSCQSSPGSRLTYKVTLHSMFWKTNHVARILRIVRSLTSTAMRDFRYEQVVFCYYLSRHRNIKIKCMWIMWRTYR